MAPNLIVSNPTVTVLQVEEHVNGNSDHVMQERKFETMCLDVIDPHYEQNQGTATQEESQDYLNHVLAMYHEHLVERADHFLGYPCYFDKDYLYQHTQLHHFPINNVGDPFIPSTYEIHSRKFEIAVLDWFARLLEIEKNEYWGYVTSGSTEANTHGLLMGRQMFPDGILYASRDSHYSLPKAAFMLRMELVTVNSLTTGEIDCADFKTKLMSNSNKPAIIFANIGTTVKGAVDDLDEIIATLQEAGFKQDRFYIHCDGALTGFMLPFLKNAPKLTFKKPVGSISISGHKFMGCPTPCGIQITRIEHINAISREVEYIATRDATISGSRNGHAPIFLWWILNQQGYKGFEKRVLKCIENARYLKYRLHEEGISVMLNEYSNTVVFERPKDEDFVRHWQLACQGNIAHIVVMPSTTTEKLDEFLNELVEKRSLWYKDHGKNRPPCVAQEIGKGNCVCSLHK